MLALSGKEFAVQRALRAFDAEAYVPLSRKFRRTNRFRREKIRIAYPATPGCVFAGFLPGQERWYEVFTDVPSLYGVLSADGAPIAVEGNRLAEFVHDNRFRFEAAEIERYMRTHYEFKTGDRVRIAEGPFEGHLVDVHEIRGAKAHILIELLGGAQEVAIPLDKLEKAA